MKYKRKCCGEEFRSPQAFGAHNRHNHIKRATRNGKAQRNGKATVDVRALLIQRIGTLRIEADRLETALLVVEEVQNG